MKPKPSRAERNAKRRAQCDADRRELLDAMEDENRGLRRLLCAERELQAAKRAFAELERETVRCRARVYGPQTIARRPL